MDPSDEEEALRIARIARRAERKAEARARAKTQQRKSRSAIAPSAVGSNVAFMGKAQREAAAIARLKADRDNAGVRPMAMAVGEVPEVGEVVQSAPQRGRQDDRRGGRGGDRREWRGRDDRGAPQRGGGRDGPGRYDRGGERFSRGRSPPPARAQAAPAPAPAALDMFASGAGRQKELAQLKASYLGGRGGSKKPPRAKLRGRQSFKADWNAADDTADTTNPLYASRMAPSLMFGRGTLAGADQDAQLSGGSFIPALIPRRQAEAAALLQAAQAAAASAQAAAETAQVVAAAAAAGEGSAVHVRGAGASTAHWSDKPLLSMTGRDWRIMREDFDIRVKGGRALAPLRNWEEGHLSDGIMRAIDVMGYKEPSPIQRQAIPFGLQFRDLIGVAETGSGKTAAFIIPMLHYIASLPQEARDATPQLGPHCLVMAPTRELAQQIEAEAVKLAKYVGIRSVSVVGGLNIEEQGLKIRQGADLVIGTPGRLIDTVENKYLMLAQCKYIVLDEADRMIDLGFEPQVKAILGAMQSQGRGEEDRGGPALSDAVTGGPASRDKDGPKGHQASDRVTIMFSATMPPEVHGLAKAYMKRPITVEIGDQDSGKNKRIKQSVIFTSEGAKGRNLTKLLTRIRTPAIVFVNAKAQTEAVARVCSAAGFPAVVLTGAKTQEQREGALGAFRRGEVPILVATGVAERGLDIPDVAHVVNYDMPSEITRYNHRIGRTGRAGKSGAATSFFTDGDGSVLWDLRKYLQATGNEVPAELLRHPGAQDPMDGAIFK